jgi:hypothetical protein
VFLYSQADTIRNNRANLSDILAESSMMEDGIIGPSCFVLSGFPSDPRKIADFLPFSPKLKQR